MPTSPNEAAARETVIRVQTGHISESVVSSHRKSWRFWSGICFAIVVLAVFVRPLLMLIGYVAGSQLHSYVLLVPFVSAYLLYLRRDQLPKKHSTDLLCALMSLAAGLGLFAYTQSLEVAAQAPAINTRIVLLTSSFLCCLAAGGLFFFCCELRRSSGFSLDYLLFLLL